MDYALAKGHRDICARLKQYAVRRNTGAVVTDSQNPAINTRNITGRNVRDMAPDQTDSLFQQYTVEVFPIVSIILVESNIHPS